MSFVTLISFLDITSMTRTFFLFAIIFCLLGLVISVLIGLRRNYLKSLYRLVGIITFVVLAFFTSSFMTIFLDNFDFSKIVDIKIDFTIKSSNISTNLTTLSGTCSSILKNLRDCLIDSQDTASLGFVNGIIDLGTGFILYVLDMLLIFVFGNLLLDILWICLFKRVIPNIVLKDGNNRVISLITSMLVFLIFASLILVPCLKINNSLLTFEQHKTAQVFNIISRTIL